MDLWDRDAIELLGPAFIEFHGEGGRFRFIAVEGTMSCTHSSRGDGAEVTFTWRGNDEFDPASGSGWVELQEDGSLAGHIAIQDGDDSDFRATPFRGIERAKKRMGTSARRRR